MNSIPCGPWRNTPDIALRDMLTGDIYRRVVHFERRDAQAYLEKSRFGQEPMLYRYCLKVDDA